ncbi:MAG TPA: hypothetical protein VLA93_20605 [Pyrinomonadaceae bacterium]|nr:hypothetical protein [Pyrinomonadaceae bacterium]
MKIATKGMTNQNRELLVLLRIITLSTRVMLTRKVLFTQPVVTSLTVHVNVRRADY